jgi:hypothetical protein
MGFSYAVSGTISAPTFVSPSKIRRATIWSFNGLIFTSTSMRETQVKPGVVLSRRIAPGVELAPLGLSHLSRVQHSIRVGRRAGFQNSWADELSHRSRKFLAEATSPLDPAFELPIPGVPPSHFMPPRVAVDWVDFK